MMMTVYYPDRTTRLDHLACIDIASTSLDIEMIMYAFLHAQPTLVGLDGRSAIIKPYDASTDDELSYIDLFDTCVTQHDFQSMKQHKVTSPSDLPPKLYTAELAIAVNVIPRIRVRLCAHGNTDVQAAYAALLADDATFRDELVKAVAGELYASTDVELVSPGWQEVQHVAPPGTPAWKIVNVGSDARMEPLKWSILNADQISDGANFSLREAVRRHTERDENGE